MKSNFKIQPFQTEMTDAAVCMFNGRPQQDRVSYRRDMGNLTGPA